MIRKELIKKCQDGKADHIKEMDSRLIKLKKEIAKDIKECEDMTFDQKMKILMKRGLMEY